MLDNFDVMDVQLLPPPTSGDLYFFMRVTRMPIRNQTEQLYQPSALLQGLCNYLESDTCKIMGIAPVMLDQRPKFISK